MAHLFFDSAVAAAVFPNQPVQLFLFLLNNDSRFKENRRPVNIKIVAPGFDPSSLELKYLLDPTEDLHFGPPEANALPLIDLMEDDIMKAMSEVLQVADAVWLSLSAKEVGRYSINVFIEDGETGAIIAGKNFRVDVKHDFGSLTKKIVGLGAVLVGAALSAAELILSTIL